MAQISLRNPLVAGLAAAIGAGVVTVAPAAHVPALPINANVALAGFDNPFEQIIGTADLVQTYLFASYYNGADSPTPGAGEANWPFAGLDQTGGDYLNYLFAQQKSLGLYHNVGLIPEIVNTHQPIITQLITNWLGYLNTTLSGAAGAGQALAAGVWNFPGAVIDSVKLALNGQVQAALTVLVSSITTPISLAATEMLGAVGGVVKDVFTKLAAVVGVIPTNLTLFGGWLLGGGSLLVKQAVAIGTEWVKELTSANFEGAWNTAVVGFLGAAGLPGSAFNLSLGPGKQTGPIVTQDDIKTNFIPSLRTAIQATFWNTQDALTAQAPGGAASIPALAAAEAPTALGEEAPTALGEEAPTALGEEAPTALGESVDATPEQGLGNTPRARLAERVATFKANAAATAHTQGKSHRAARTNRSAAN